MVRAICLAVLRLITSSNLRWLLDRQIGGLGAFQDLVHVICDALGKLSACVCPVAHDARRPLQRPGSPYADGIRLFNAKPAIRLSFSTRERAARRARRVHPGAACLAQRILLVGGAGPRSAYLSEGWNRQLQNARAATGRTSCSRRATLGGVAGSVENGDTGKFGNGCL